jgi:hypothetical protein
MNGRHDVGGLHGPGVDPSGTAGAGADFSCGLGKRVFGLVPVLGCLDQ